MSRSWLRFWTGPFRSAANRGGSVPSNSVAATNCSGSAGPPSESPMPGSGPLAPGGIGVVMARSRSSVQPDSRIQEGIQDIHQRAEHHVREDPEYHDGHYHWIVVLHNRLVQQIAEPVILEDRLRDDRATQQDADADADVGDHRDDRVAERVLADHLALGKALGPCRSDVVGAQHLEHR